MVRKNRKKEKKYSLSTKMFILLARFIWFLIKIPYYLVKGLYLLVKKLNAQSEHIVVERRRNSIKADYSDFEVLKTIEGDYHLWENMIYEYCRVRYAKCS